MNIKTAYRVLGLGLLAGALTLGGCGGGADGGSDESTASVPVGAASPSGAAPTLITTDQLLLIALAPSETADPFAVGTNAYLVADQNDETSDPEPVG